MFAVLAQILHVHIINFIYCADYSQGNDEDFDLDIDYNISSHKAVDSRAGVSVAEIAIKSADNAEELSYSTDESINEVNNCSDANGGEKGADDIRIPESSSIDEMSDTVTPKNESGLDGMEKEESAAKRRKLSHNDEEPAYYAMPINETAYKEVR